MNFSCRVEHFGKALSQVGKAVCSKGALPVLSNILVLAESEGRVVLSSTDLETSIKSILPAKVEQAGAITIPYRILSDLFGNLTFEVLSFSSQEQKIDLTGEGFSSRIVGLSADEFPQLSDLRESGSIEQDADVVMFIHREEQYNPDAEQKGVADLIIAKHRNGPTGRYELAFVKELGSFRNLEKRKKTE